MLGVTRREHLDCGLETTLLRMRDGLFSAELLEIFEWTGLRK